MATINSALPLSYRTNLNKLPNKNAIIFNDQSFHIETLTNNEKVRGEIVFTELSETEKDEVMTFYTTNKDLSFDFVDPNDGETYSLYFEGAPPKPVKMPDRYETQYEVTYSVIGE